MCALVRERPGIEREVLELEAAKKKDARYFPRKLSTLLEDWTGALDSVRNPSFGQRLDANGKPPGKSLVEKLADEQLAAVMRDEAKSPPSTVPCVPFSAEFLQSLKSKP